MWNLENSINGNDVQVLPKKDEPNQPDGGVVKAMAITLQVWLTCNLTLNVRYHCVDHKCQWEICHHSDFFERLDE